MTSPVVNGPRDVPELRNWLAMRWLPGEAFALAAAQYVYKQNQERADANPVEFEEELASIVAWNLYGLRGCSMWYVEQSMAELVSSSAAELPSTVLHPELVPAKGPVLVVFETPLVGFDAVMTENNDVRVDALMFASSVSGFSYEGHRVAHDSWSLTMYSKIRLEDGMTAAEMEQAAELLREVDPGVYVRGGRQGHLFVPVGRTDWLVGKAFDWRWPGCEDRTHESQTEDRRWLLALWRLASTPRLAEHRQERPDRAARRRAERSGESVDAEVTVVSLRRPVFRGGDDAGVGDGGGKRVYRHRWTVTGHWRNQAYGPGRKLRRPVFIESYVKGPEDAPMKEGAVVRLLASSPRRRK